jgi:surface carbohydrate biosynthesis protein
MQSKPDGKLKRVGIVVDHPKRDLDGAVRLAHALLNRGAETCLIPLYDQGVDVPLLDLDVLVINYARPVNLALVTGYVAQGVPVFVLDTEGGVLSQEGANSIRGLTDYIAQSDYVRLLRGYFFWGGSLRDAFAEAGILQPGGLHLTGCPRFDVTSQRWRGTLDYPRSGYILVNANFPLVNPAFAKDAGGEAKVLVGSGWDQDYVRRMVADQTGILAGFIDTVKRLAACLPNMRFVVRPHPFESDVIYRSAFAGLDNVTVDGAGNVLNVIRHCACLVHLNCGTSIEAVMLERLPVSMEFLNTEHMANHSTLPSKISMKAGTFEELVAILGDLPSAFRKFDFDGTYRRFIHDFFHDNDGAAGDRVAKALLADPGRSKRLGLQSRIFWSLASSRTESRIWQRFQAAAANILGTRAVAWLRSRVQAARRGKVLDAKAIRRLASSLARHEGLRAPEVFNARHPVTRLPLSSVIVRPRRVAAEGR